MLVAPGHIYAWSVGGGVCVYVGCPCVLWDGQEVGGCPGDARARSTGAWPMVA